MTILAGMQLGGQNPFSTFTKKKEKRFLMPASRHLHIFTQCRELPGDFCSKGILQCWRQGKGN